MLKQALKETDDCSSVGRILWC